MEKFIGVKRVLAKPMTRGAYNELRGWDTPPEEDEMDAGYLVEYLGSPNKNHPDFDNYISWSPEEVFNNAYRKFGEMSFGDAVEALKAGYPVARKGWNGKGMYVFKQIPAEIGLEIIPKMQSVPESVKGDMMARNQSLKYTNQMAIVHPDGRVDSWAPSSSDVFAEDWFVLIPVSAE